MVLDVGVWVVRRRYDDGYVRGDQQNLRHTDVVFVVCSAGYLDMAGALFIDGCLDDVELVHPGSPRRC